MTGQKPEELLHFANSAWMLWAESCAVVALRSWTIMGGGAAAHSEAVRMVTEKVQVGGELALKAASGDLGTGLTMAQRSLEHYGHMVSANRKRPAKRR